MENIIKAETTIKNLSYEVGIIFDLEGNKVWEATGTERNINVHEAMEQGLTLGKVFTHNHPRTGSIAGGSFSRNDIKVMLVGRLYQMRAVDEINTHIVTVKKVCPSDKLEAELNKIMNKADQAEKRLQAEIMASIENNTELSFDDIHHEIWVEAFKYNRYFRYNRETNTEVEVASVTTLNTIEIVETTAKTPEDVATINTNAIVETHEAIQKRIDKLELIYSTCTDDMQSQRLLQRIQNLEKCVTYEQYKSKYDKNRLTV